jgi:hypothetical protein
VSAIARRADISCQLDAEATRVVIPPPGLPTRRRRHARGGDRRCVLICTTAGMKEHKWDGWGTVAVTGGAFVTDTAGQRTGRSARPAP